MRGPVAFAKAKAAALRGRNVNQSDASARFWATRHEQTPEVWPAHWDSRDAPYRRELLDRLCALPAASSFFEVGCGCGPNLWGLAHRRPNSILAGVDVSDAAIEYGRAALAREGITATLERAAADELPFEPISSISPSPVV
jgi:trans-aconitate methyltransferase